MLIYLLEDAGTHADLAGVIIDAVEDRRVDGVLASVGVAEILAGSGPGARRCPIRADCR